ncbi:MAG TPA: hypothetical protein VNV42_10170 [Solirubrobacteraceae bacterium]|jgi:hypothetical protein|nr:hypothetical protein [Solirubrobacteraceae bacterium]
MMTVFGVRAGHDAASARARRAPLALGATVFLTVLLVGAVRAPASLAASPWWHLTSISSPTDLQPEGTGEVIVTASNLGDGPADGEASPVTIADTLPTGLHALKLEAVTGRGAGLRDGPVGCLLSTLTCTFAGTLPAYDQIEVRIEVRVEPGASSGELNRVSVSGGGAPPASLARPVTLGEASPFGVADYEDAAEEEGGASDVQAGSHPFQFTTTIMLDESSAGKNKFGEYEAHPAGLAKDIKVKLPPGLIGNPTPFPQCPLADFFKDPSGNETWCPSQTVVGIAIVKFNEPGLNGVVTFTVPIVNLEPAFGEPARFGFLLPVTPVFLTTSVRSGSDYGITVSSLNISETASFLGIETIFWGTPGDPRHNSSRGSGCLAQEHGYSVNVPCSSVEESHPPALMIMPAACGGPLSSSMEVDSWEAPAEALSVGSTAPMAAFNGCNRLQFAPNVSAEPTTDKASAPSGLDFNINFHDEGLTSGTGIAESELKDTTVTLPEGFTINPSAGVGLAGCTEADYAREAVASLAGEGCPNDSKLGTVEVTTPLLSTVLHGSLYVAQPYENPFDSLVALYVVLRDPEAGVLIKLAGKVTPNPLTGQLTTTFENNPQLPFAHFNFHFREGQQAPLITPALCGTYQVQADLTPWSEPETTLGLFTPFQITQGYDGGACPAGGAPPFAPQIQAGTLDNSAGSFSSLYVRLSRNDDEQEIAGFSTDLPPGLTGDLSGIPFCPDADIEAARHESGAREEAEPSCPAASEIGHTVVGTGVGAVLAYVPGRLYLAGPFEGAPFSVVSITSAKVGPFDLGTVVLRFGLEIDPHTAQVSVAPSSSEPIPTIIDGIVTHVRDIRVYVDRPGFILNPTNCDRMSLASTLSAHEGASAAIASPFQTADCQSLKFAPKFAVSTSGKTSRLGGASLGVKLTYPAGALGEDANIKQVKVELPKQLPSRLPTLQKACTQAQFKVNPAGCPAASVIGQARAVTPILPVALEGPVYFVSNGGEAFPNLIMVLQGYGVTIDLVGDTFISKAGVTSSTFKTVPDEPVTSFELELPEGPHSALAAIGNLCKQKLTMPTEMLAQNGAAIHQNTKIAVTGCPKGRHLKHRKKGHAKKAVRARRSARRRR